MFTETVRAANHAINRLDPLVSIDLITGSTARRQRREILDDLRDRKLDAVAAPRVLDEGIDVPDANLGIVMSASRTRRQMIQRMGRILRRKRPGIAARFVIMFAKDTLEDPAQPDRARRLPRRDRAHLRSERACSTARASRSSTPSSPPRPRRRCPSPSASSATSVPWCTPIGEASLASEATVEHLAEQMGVEAAYAFLSFADRDPSGAPRDAAIRVLGPRLPKPAPRDAPYLELELANLPPIAAPEGRAAAAVDRTGAARDRAASATRGGSAARAAARRPSS